MNDDVFAVKLITLKEAEEKGFKIVINILQTHPAWSGEYVRIKNGYIDDVYCFPYMVTEALTKEEALEVCPYIFA